MGSEKLKDRGKMNGYKNRAVVVPGTEPYLRDVLGFLRNNAENIRQIIFHNSDSGLILRTSSLKKNEKNQFELFFLGHWLWIFLGFLFLFIGHELVRLLTL